MEFRVRRSMPCDLPAVRSLAQQCQEAPRWSDAAWEEVFAAGDGRRVCLVAETASGIAGFAVAHRAVEPAELESVAVAPEMRRLGIGRALCEAAMSWCGERMAAMELEVRASSEGALTLYTALGFREQGRRRSYYSDPVDDAVLMSARL